MKNINYIIFTLFFLAFGSSCNDDFLEVPNKELLTEESFWQTEDHAFQALTAAYGALQSHSGSKWAFFEEIYTTMVYRGDDIFNNSSEIYGRAMANFTNTTEQSGPYNIWLACYAGIGRANQIMQKIPEMEALTQEQIDVFVAEAKFLRALYYFWLVTGFENVPLVTTFETDPELLFPKQTPPEQVWVQIEKDLQEAEMHMVDNHESNWLGRATKGSATALLGKVYLFMERWGDAEGKFEEVIMSNNYDLLPKFEDNFSGYFENNVESIFEIQFTGDRSNGNDERTPFNFEVSPYAFGGWELFYPSDWLLEVMKTDTTATGEISDRVYESIFFDDPNSEMYSLGDGINIVYDDIRDDLNYTNYFKKYAFAADESFYIGTNVSVIRYADVLLMYAEALNENDKTSNAIEEVNKVRVRGNAEPLAGLNKDELRNQIRHHERPVELAMEFGIRWFDLYRWERGSVAKESIKATLSAHNKPFIENFQEGKHEIFPIPLQEININGNLDQNDNW